MASPEEILEQLFPRLSTTAYEITSSRDKSYNCIAFAADDDSRWWWPDGLSYWPTDERVETLDAFLRAFESEGYSRCDNGDLEEEFEKIAIYTDVNGEPTHMARQLPTGKWTSKLGPLEDIEHELEGLARSSYGFVFAFMKRMI